MKKRTLDYIETTVTKPVNFRIPMEVLEEVRRKVEAHNARKAPAQKITLTDVVVAGLRRFVKEG